jgi:outer membrane protein assembly factor BamB
MQVTRGGTRAILGWLVVSGGALLAQQEGQQQWRFSVNGFITLSSPALSPDGATVYVGVETASGGRFIAASALDGGSRWGLQGRVLAELSESSPAVGPDGTIYIGAGRDNGRLYALNPANGSSLWEVPLHGFASSSPAVGSDGTIYVGAGDGRLHAVSRGGTWLWGFQTGGVIFSSPAIAADGTLYIGSYDRNFYAVTPSGEERWRFATAGAIFSSPAIGADGTIYFGSGDQRLYALAPDGSYKWDYFTDGPVDASPTLGADGTIYVASDRSLYALRPGDNVERLRWRRDISSGSISSAAVRADGAIIFGADDGVVRALNADGTDRWRFDTRSGPGNLIESSPIIAPDGSIFIGSYDGALYKINGNGSPLSGQSSWPAFRSDTRHTSRARVTNTGGRLVNISTRAQAGGGRNLIAGFVVQATQGRAYLIRAVGPGLQASNVGGFMPDPRLQLFSGQMAFRTNDNWFPNDESNQLSLPETSAAVQAFPLQPGSADAAILPALPPGVFTAHVESVDERPGVALVEVYDGLAGDPTARLLNLSTRGFVGTDDDILIAGFVVGGTGSMRLLLRAIGPGLTQFGVAGAIAQPRLTLFRGGTPIASNTGWTTTGNRGDVAGAGAAVSAFPLAENSVDSAMLFEAAPGAYTIQIAGVGGTTGEAMVEIYVLP